MVSLFFSLSVKSVFAMLTLPRGSAHEIAFAAQMHENRGRVPRFSYFRTSVFCKAKTQIVGKTVVFRQSQKERNRMVSLFFAQIQPLPSLQAQ